MTENVPAKAKASKIFENADYMHESEEMPESQIELETRFIEPKARSDVIKSIKKKTLFEQQLPIENVFTRDKTTSNLDPRDYKLANRYARLCELLKFMMIVTGNDEYRFAHDFYNGILTGKCDLAKSKGGWSNLMVRSKFAEYKALETVIEHALEEEKAKQKGFGRLLQGFPFKKKQPQAREGGF